MGKICVSICAETAEEFKKALSDAQMEEFSDVIELRFDCLLPEEFANLRFSTKSVKPLLATYRPKEQGGCRELSFEERERFWNNGPETDWADCEEEFIEGSQNWPWSKVIGSYHDFDGMPENLPEIYERLKASKADIIKIAAKADDITDSLEIWKLLKKAKSENREIIPIAMGEAGKWTRILGLSHGAYLTYASIDAGKETAPGQVSAQDLAETYRAKELDEETEIYGIIGKPLSHSLSPYMHNAAFKYHQMNAVYLPFECNSAGSFIKFLKESELNIKGFSITIPFKQDILQYLDWMDEDAEAAGAANTVKIIDGRLHGYNTDAEGLIAPLKLAYSSLRGARIAVIGAGGAAGAAVYALKKEGAEITVFGRNDEKLKAFGAAHSLKCLQINEVKDFNGFDILINTTPLGMKGEWIDQSPASAEQIAKVNLIYDLVYSPFQTKLLQEADKASAPKIGGMAMLAAQGIKQFEIWTGKEAPMKIMSAEILKRI